ncbi:odorant receptor 10a [Lucilia sericata]|uniref:odorant receptor 10a n=1 Tax=Lucilia sericata TaxID=13632 RepID=UPI0018A7F0F8|nr:odorant receptor 10a [Lucilia sericata]
MSLKFLSSSYPLLDYYFYVPKYCLRIMGFWPQTPKTTLHQLWAASNFLILLIGVLTEMHAGFSALTYDLEKGLDTLCPAGTSAVTLLKMVLIFYYRKDINYVLKKMHGMLYDEGASGQILRKHHKIIRKFSVLAARFNFAPFLTGFITNTTYILKPLIMAWIFWSKGKEIQWTTPFNMTMPRILLHAPLFPLAYIFTAYTGFITIFIFSGCDAFYFEFCSHIASLLQMLQSDIESLFDMFENRLILSEKENQYVENRLKIIIRRHNEINDLTYFFRKRYTVITLAHFVSAALVIGASIFDLMTYTGFGRLIYVAYTVAALCQLMVYCYGGSMVAENSVEISNVIFGCNWFICNQKVRRMVLLIIIRSQRTLTMSVPFFSPSLATFASILQTSGSIIALASSFQ